MLRASALWKGRDSLSQEAVQMMVEWPNSSTGSNGYGDNVAHVHCEAVDTWRYVYVVWIKEAQLGEVRTSTRRTPH